MERRESPGPPSGAGRGSTWRRVALVALPVIVVAGVVAAFALGGDDGGDRADRQVTTDGTQGPATSATVAANPSTTASTVVSGQSDSTVGATTLPGSATTTPGPSVTTAPDDRPGARIQVKFAAGSGVRLRDGGFVSVTGHDLSALQDTMGRYPAVGFERVFQRSEEDLEAERAANEARTGQPQPDLNLYYRITLAEGVDANAVIAELGGLEIVERAYADPVAAPPPMG